MISHFSFNRGAFRYLIGSSKSHNERAKQAGDLDIFLGHKKYRGESSVKLTALDKVSSFAHIALERREAAKAESENANLPKYAACGKGSHLPRNPVSATMWKHFDFFSSLNEFSFSRKLFAHVS